MNEWWSELLCTVYVLIQNATLLENDKTFKTPIHFLKCYTEKKTACMKEWFRFSYAQSVIIAEDEGTKRTKFLTEQKTQVPGVSAHASVHACVF